MNEEERNRVSESMVHVGGASLAFMAAYGGIRWVTSMLPSKVRAFGGLFVTNGLVFGLIGYAIWNYNDVPENSFESWAKDASGASTTNSSGRGHDGKG